MQVKLNYIFYANPSDTELLQRIAFKKNWEVSGERFSVFDNNFVEWEIESKVTRVVNKYNKQNKTILIKLRRVN